MAFMLKIRWDIKMGRGEDFRTNQEALCTVMLEHPGVICYHADYPSDGVLAFLRRSASILSASAFPFRLLRSRL